MAANTSPVVMVVDLFPWRSLESSLNSGACPFSCPLSVVREGTCPNVFSSLKSSMTIEVPWPKTSRRSRSMLLPPNAV
jgi:hypothetical protein